MSCMAGCSGLDLPISSHLSTTATQVRREHPRTFNPLRPLLNPGCRPMYPLKKYMPGKGAEIPSTIMLNAFCTLFTVRLARKKNTIGDAFDLIRVCGCTMAGEGPRDLLDDASRCGMAYESTAHVRRGPDHTRTRRRHGRTA
ncbi:hypothetical protein U9M48_041279 [Paspalum notatum var. saurae]|uniref:Uncharacterized protein n=1 Tax=Paspalum notatum var. saurae TaxID=547442 RepID=A0AAQ3XD63_PASNO